MNFLNQCCALITGASSGFGEEFARQLAPFASELILVARREERLQALQKELSRPGLKIHIRKTDLTCRDEVQELVAWVKELGLPVNFLINNAGFGDHGFFETGDAGKIQRLLDLNIGALTLLTHGLIPVLKKQPRAAILNVSSVAALTPIPKMAVYGASKAYVSSFSEALRAELRASGVRVVTLCPGPVSTEFGAVAERSGAVDTMPAPEIFKVSTQKVVRDGLYAVERNVARKIPGWFVTFVMLLTAAMPMVILRLAMRGQVKGSER